MEKYVLWLEPGPKPFTLMNTQCVDLMSSSIVTDFFLAIRDRSRLFAITAFVWYVVSSALSANVISTCNSAKMVAL